MARLLIAEEWRAVLSRLSETLPATRQRHVTVIGGVAMALGYGSRRTTGDADVILQSADAREVLLAAAGIANEFQLPTDWMNQKAVEASGCTLGDAR